MGDADMPGMEPNALALEYKGIYGTASGDLDVADLVNNPTANCKCSVFGLCFAEEVGDGVLFNPSPLLNDGTDPFLIRKNGV